MVDNSNLKCTISLPRGAFEPYNRAKANILFFTDCHYSSQVKHYWHFSVKNDGYTLDKRRERVDGGNDLEIVLSERNLEKQTDEYLLSIGVTRIPISQIKANKYILAAGHYLNGSKRKSPGKKFLKLDELLELSGTERIGNEQDTPVMSITMHEGLIDQKKKFYKRVASKDISKYKKVYMNELVVGFPIDEGVLGFQTKYEYAAVSPAYKIWRLKRHNIDVRVIEMILRSGSMREIYKSKMQGAVDRRRSIPNDVSLDIEIPVPSSNIIRKIIKRFDELAAAKQQVAVNNASLKDAVERLFLI